MQKDIDKGGVDNFSVHRHNIDNSLSLTVFIYHQLDDAKRNELAAFLERQIANSIRGWAEL